MVLLLATIGLGAAYLSSLSPKSVDDLFSKLAKEASGGVQMLLAKGKDLQSPGASRVEVVGRRGRLKLAGAALLLAGVIVARKAYRRYTATKIKGATVVITGASQGIGAALAEELSKRGATKIILVARTEAKLKRVRDTINDARPGTAVYRCVDVSSAVAVGQLADSMSAPPDILVNCAGAGTWRFLPESSIAELKANISAPYLAAMWTSRAFIKSMVDRGVGTIVNVQSPAAYSPFGGATGYIAGRYALRGLSDAMRADCRGSGVSVQEVVLTLTKSNYFVNNPGSKDRIPILGRLGGSLTSQRAAEGIANAIESGQDMYVWGHRLYCMFLLNEWCPWLVAPLVQLSGWSMKRNKSQWTPSSV